MILISQISFAHGIDAAAPFLDTAIEEAFAASKSASLGDSFFCIPVKKYPVKVSPAPVVSTTFVRMAG